MAENDQGIFSVEDGGSQSDKANGTKTEEKLFDYSGRKLTAEQLHEETLKLQKDYTEKTTELSQLKKTETPPDPVPENVKEELKKYGVVFKEELEKQRVQDKLDLELTSLENKYNGSDGRPAFRRGDVLPHMQSSQIFNPEKAYRDLHGDKLQEIAIKEYLEKKQGIPSAERGSSAGGSVPPETPTSYGKMSNRDFTATLTSEIENILGRKSRN